MAVAITLLDCDLMLFGRGHRTLDRFKLNDVTDDYLISVFGFPKQFIYYLVELLGRSLCRPTQRSRAILPETQILAALGFYTSGSFQNLVGSIIGISQASMSRCVADVTEALVERASQLICFPSTLPAQQEITEEFFGVARMPNVMGVVGCTQVAIKAPNPDLSYVNKKGCHSISCQLVCDAKGRILSVESHFPGSLQSSAVFQQSDVNKLFHDGVLKDGWLLGSSVYSLRKWLLTPLQILETPADYQYNMAHTATYSIMEQVLTSLRSRFRCLDGSKGTLQYTPEKCGHIVVACCVLHNIALQRGLELCTPEELVKQEQPEAEEYEPVDSIDTEAFHMRQEFIQTHFS
ncbi:putative nuclease HARBI1 [Protopterus annectens]|uniref:putative nuclease HARBI1 n=1 Tax=Protopterus annectens TaxID=7888 RepID=UPI001CFB1788|nr:putative nuclease HARBI1 [Protopterus annectens]XP_043938545.1 putative nuclease HARBI1 [Protopterus annectens]XP_043938546.1 putative nuclease HARBI1 [Protopterus annectens]XP_043938547.1 putative nuclease HARBI1 [Protopterus annectens]XP_043938548.1 putative nuclease HARBI1 [Protopterus annectens]XP_043938549.1 putative nuclease HARBI1 [Protopterus annectens]XP_043938550.1 putative nuclease HARBI1 [Protopterus annectens]